MKHLKPFTIFEQNLLLKTVTQKKPTTQSSSSVKPTTEPKFQHTSLTNPIREYKVGDIIKLKVGGAIKTFKVESIITQKDYDGTLVTGYKGLIDGNSQVLQINTEDLKSFIDDKGTKFELSK
jgi:hypothetical protein